MSETSQSDVHLRWMREAMHMVRIHHNMPLGPLAI